MKPPSFVPNRQEVVHDIRKTVGGAICDPEDSIKDVLDDNDFVSIGKKLLILYKFSSAEKPEMFKAKKVQFGPASAPNFIMGLVANPPYHHKR